MAKKKTVRVDFGDVPKEVGARGRLIDEGNYLCKITKVEKKRKEGAPAPYFNWVLQVIADDRGKTKFKGVPLYHITSLKREALFNLRNLIFAATDGKKNVAGSSVDFNPNNFIGKRVGVVLEHEEYDKKMRNRVVDLLPPSQLVAEEDEEEEEEDDDYDDEDEDDEEEDEDDDDLDEVDEDEDL